MELQTVCNVGQRIRNKDSGLIMVITGSYVGGYVTELPPDAKTAFGKFQLPFENIGQWETVEE